MMGTRFATNCGANFAPMVASKFLTTFAASFGVPTYARRCHACGAALFLLVGCGGAATKILPVSPAAAAQTLHACERVFPVTPFEVTHVVEASIPFSDDASLIGVVVAEQKNKGFRSVLMTQEGLVLFDAIRRGEAIEIVRAVPPIDPDGFGRHMTDDVRLILLRPDGDRPEVGRSNDGAPICRWSHGDEQVEVLVEGPDRARLTRLRNGSIERHATLSGIDENGFAREALLETTSLIGYQLHLLIVSMNRRTPGANGVANGATPSPQSNGAPPSPQSNGATPSPQSNGAPPSPQSNGAPAE